MRSQALAALTLDVPIARGTNYPMTLHTLEWGADAEGLFQGDNVGDDRNPDSGGGWTRLKKG